MKYTFTFFMTILLFISVGKIEGRQADPKFGKYSTEEQTMTFCGFEPEADAVVLFESASSSFISGLLYTHFHFRKKLFNQNSKGFGDVVIRYYYGKDGTEVINNIKAQTVNWVNGKMEITKLTKDEIFEVDAENGYKEYRLVFPNVREGSIIEYTYKKVDKNITFLDGWSFQNQIPTLRSKYSIAIPNYLNYQSWSQGVNMLALEGKPTMVRDAYTWELTNLRSMRPEPYLNNFGDYLDKIQFQLQGYKTRKNPGDRIDYKEVFTTWDESAKEILKISVVAGYLKNNSSTRFLNEIDFVSENKMDLLNKVESYVQNNYESNSSSGIIPSVSITELKQSKIGNKAAVNLLLVALLKAQGIDAYPYLISSKGNGRSKLVQYPFINQFNQMIAVALIDGDYYFLDGADKGLTPGYLALDNHVSEGFLMKDSGSGLIPMSLKHKSGRTQTVKIKLDEEKQLAFDYLARYNDYDAIQLKLELGEDLQSDKIQEVYFKENDKPIHEFSIQTSEGKSHQVNVNYKIAEKFNDEVSTLLIAPFNNLRFKDNPFKEEIRQFPVDFNFVFNDYYVANITIPEGYELDDVPENINVVLPDGNFRFIYTVTSLEDEVMISSQLILKSSILPPSEYENLKTFIELVLNKHKEPLVFKKLGSTLTGAERISADTE